MRIDHHAYQRATRVAGFGLLVQALVALALLLFGRLAGDSAFTFASMYVGLGVVVFLGLIVIFHQHKLERLEALEEEELAAAGGETAGGSVFDRSDEDIRVAARRLRLMHGWLMPILSIAIAIGLAGAAWSILAWLSGLGDPETDHVFLRTDNLGWAVAICLAFAAVSFIISRFVAGMAKQTVWQNLRGGAGYMVGNAVVLLAVAIGVVFQFFDNDQVIVYVCYAIAIFMIAFAVEILLNLLLNFYRPRVPGEVPRPAFDSKVLSLLAAPDNLVRSINEAINYQFGFDVTSTWGYQLLLRSFVALIAIGVVVLVALNTMVVVEPHQQALRLRFGSLVGEPGEQVHGSGLLWKLPWPVETAAVYDVARIRTVSLTARRTREAEYWNWEDSLEGRTDVPIEPFIVRSSTDSRGAAVIDMPEVDPAASDQQRAADDELRRRLALANLEVTLDYRIKPDGGLLDYLAFGDDTIERRQRLTTRERAIRNVALSELTAVLADMPLDEVLDQDDGALAGNLRRGVQQRFDALRCGVDVIAVNLLMIRPEASEHFAELPVADQVWIEERDKARQQVAQTFGAIIGDEQLVDDVLGAINDYQDVEDQLARLPADAANDQRQTVQQQLNDQRERVESLLVRGGGQAAYLITAAESNRWVKYMSRRARAVATRSQIRAYQAAPRLYRERMLMDVYLRHMAREPKFILGFDPGDVRVNIDMKQLNPVFNFQDTQEDLEKDMAP